MDSESRLLPEVAVANVLLLVAGVKRDPVLESLLGGAIVALRSMHVEKDEPSVGAEGMGAVPVGPGAVPQDDSQTPEGVEQTGGTA